MEMKKIAKGWMVKCPPVRRTIRFCEYGVKGRGTRRRLENIYTTHYFAIDFPAGFKNSQPGSCEEQEAMLRYYKRLQKKVPKLIPFKNKWSLPI